MPDFLDSLNERQRAAVCHEDGGALVLAGAGTGKTRVLTSRIARLTSVCGCSPRAVLAVTFTNKAAKEMRGRVAALSSFSHGELMLGTFHGICHRMLKIHAAAAGWDKNFQILDSSDQKTFVRRLLAEHKINAEEFPFAECVRYINAAKDRGQRAEDITEKYARGQAMGEIYALYEAACRRDNKMDFAELQLSAIDLLRRNNDLRAHYAARFRHILIDEFQDTSPLQYRWLRLLDSGDNIFFAVGDDDQSIYAFRGADPENMRRVQSDLRARTIIRLEENYRSSAHILSVANTLIATNKRRLGKTLFTVAGNGTKVVLRRASTDLDEASGIARAVREKIADGTPATGIAVLYRTNAQSRLLEKAMIEHGIPYRIYGGTRFFERLEIKHALAYTRLAVVNDRDALLRVINTPPRGIGGQTIAELSAGGDIFAALGESPKAKVRAFCALMDKLRVRRENSSLPELVRAAVEDSGLLAHYESRAEESERAGNLRELVSAAVRFEQEFERENENENEDVVSAFLANAALESGESVGADGEAVNLLTAHASKGLEFLVVHIAGLEQGMFPSSHSLDAMDATGAGLEEERRLMYVAVTRARRELCLHFADDRMVFGQRQLRPYSLFLDELPPAAVSGLEALKRPRAAPTFGRTGAYANAYTNPAAKAAFAAKSRVDFRPASESPAESAAPSAKYRPGELVRHPKHGTGVVLRCEGRGEKQKVEVAFKKIGAKTFIIALANLSRVS